MHIRKIWFIFVFFLICSNTSVLSQLRKAERLYNRTNYAAAAYHYKNALGKAKDQIPILAKLLECYYNTYEYEKGVFYGRQLVQYGTINKDPLKYKDLHFKYAQLLAATTNYNESLFHLNLYRKSFGLTPIEQDDVLEVFKLKNPRYNLKKVGFNTHASEFGAVKSKGAIYFVSDRETSMGKMYSWTQRKFLDVFRVNEKGNKSDGADPERLPPPINSEWHDGPFCFSKDGNTIYFSRNNTDGKGRMVMAKGKNTLQLYVSKKTKNSWSTPKKLDFCRSEFNYMHPTLDEQTGVLYFSSDGPGGLGGYDIYKVKIHNDGKLGSPVNLGEPVNTPAREQFPFIAMDGDLFFSSNGHMGFGLLDVYMVRKENNGFGNPINLGTPINSKYEDFSFVEYEDGKGFYSTNRNKNNDQVYEFVQLRPWD